MARNPLPAIPDVSRRHLTIAMWSIFGVVGFFILIALIGGTVKKTPRDKIGISYGGGPIEGQHFQQVVEPGHGLFINGFADKLYLYPVTQRNYIISQRTDEGDIEGEDAVRRRRRTASR